ncbi:MAG: TadE/TadG family type IV pilus assembly protein [Rhizomicrobium sp.]
MRAAKFRLLFAHKGDRTEAGVAAVEFAFLVPVFLVLLMGVIDVGQMLFAYYELDQAVAAGAQYAALNAANVTSTNGAALATSIATTIANANGTNWSNGTVVVNDGPTVTITGGNTVSSGTATNADDFYCLAGSSPNWSWGTGYTSQSACANGGTAGKFVTVTATYAYVPVLQIYDFIQSGTLTQSAAVQTQ